MTHPFPNPRQQVSNPYWFESAGLIGRGFHLFTHGADRSAQSD